MSIFEIVAAAFGVVSVYLSTRQNVWSWPTSLVNNLMYIVHFFGVKLYALMALNGIFAIIAMYGWYQWKFGGTGRSELQVTRTPARTAVLLAAISLGSLAAIWFVLEHHTEDAAPGMDAMFFAVSLVAQYMMARKLYECWWIWVALNCAAVPFFFLQKSYPTMVQYAVFLVLATQGWRYWRASLAPQTVRG
jgi:nicotinamide mononucleotide transporter